MTDLFHESDFPDQEYDAFYSHHFFQPMDNEYVHNAHVVLPRVAWALEVAKRDQPKTVLDLGCLEGYALITLAHHVGVSGEGVDLSQEAIESAQKHIESRGMKDLKFTQDKCEAYMEKLIKQGKKFDLILCFELIEHVEDPDHFRDLMDQLVSDTGSILISTPSFESPMFGMDDERNKCHVRLFTTEDDDYHAINRYGNERLGTSMPTFIGNGDPDAGYKRIVNMEVVKELINVQYK